MKKTITATILVLCMVVTFMPRLSLAYADNDENGNINGESVLYEENSFANDNEDNSLNLNAETSDLEMPDGEENDMDDFSAIEDDNDSGDDDEGNTVEPEKPDDQQQLDLEDVHEHIAGEWVVIPASFNNDGSKTKSCTECGEVLETETIYCVSNVSVKSGVIYTGSALEPDVILTDSQGNVLEQDIDYTVEYLNNTNIGKATARVTLQGDYSGTKDVTFEIINGNLKKINLKVGETKEVSIDSNTTSLLGTDISFSIEDTSIASIDSNGLVTGLKKGSTVINAVLGDCTFKCTLNVFEVKPDPEVVYEFDGNDDYQDWYTYEFVYEGGVTYDVIVNKAIVYYKEFDYSEYEYVNRNKKCDVIVSLYKMESDSIYSEENELLDEDKFANGKGEWLIDPNLMQVGEKYAITIFIEDNIDYYIDECTLDHYNAKFSITKTSVPEMIAFDEPECKLLVSESKKLSYITDGKYTKAINWTSSDDTIASVTSNGTVTAKKPGECVVTACLPNGYQDQCTVVVSKYRTVTITTPKIQLKGFGSKTLSLEKRESIVDTIIWKSSNTKIATVNSNGKVTAKQEGVVKITASIPGSKDVCTVTVVPALKSEKVSIYLKNTYTNKLNAATGTAKWTTSNKNIATVSSSGVITGQKPGTCTITATYKGKKYTCKVTVKPIELSKTSVRINRGKTYKLTVTGGSGKITWKTSNKKVATVNSKGVIKAVNPGTCTITMKRNGYAKTCKVTVYRLEPDFGAVLYDYDTRNNRFEVKFKNNGTKTLTINSGIKVEDVDYKSFDRKITLSKSVSIAPGKTKYVYFKVKGKVTWYDYSDFTLMYYFTYDGAKYRGHVWDEDSVFKWGNKGWYNTYNDEDWYNEWY